MRPSRGMGAIKKTIRRKDNPNAVSVYAKGGKAQKRAAKTPAIKEKQRPPKKPATPRLGPPLKKFKPRRWPKELD